MFPIGHAEVIAPVQCACVIYVVACFASCAEPTATIDAPAGAQGSDGEGKDIPTKLPSAHYFLGTNDLHEFQKGRSKDDILKAVEWRGDLQMAGLYKGKSASAISYDLFSQGPASDGGEVVFAIFLDEKFAKFIKWFAPEMIRVPYEGTTRSYHKPVEIGDLSWLTRAIEKESIDITELKKEFEERPKPPSQIDPGLTTAVLLLKSLGLTPNPATEKDFTRNAQLRDQFNAARLKIGMSPAEVQAVFKAKPLESGKVVAGDFQVYGSSESFDIDPVLLYSNVLVLFKDGKANVIYAIDGGSDWRQEAQEWFSDFPRND